MSCGREAGPFSQQSIVLPKSEYIQLKWTANYWQTQHARAVEREAALKEEVEHYKAQVRDLRQRLYGKKSEQSSGVTSGQEPKARGKRGQQAGRSGHGRTSHSHLPMVEEHWDLDEEHKCCSRCGQPFIPFARTEDSEIVEVCVRAHICKIRRHQYLKGCDCEGLPGIISAAPAPRLIQKSAIGVSIWAYVLIGKYLYSQPMHRLCTELGHWGWPVAQGMLTDGFNKLAPLFTPLVRAMYEKQMSERLFHGDETGWKVFEPIEGKVGYRWYLWVTQSPSVVFYRMAPGRGADVPKRHFAALASECTEVILVCDRYVAYKCLAEDHGVIVLAFCWAHVRRDFLDTARRCPLLEAWMLGWVEDIGELYRLNAHRLEVWDETRSLGSNNPQPSWRGRRRCAKNWHRCNTGAMNRWAITSCPVPSKRCSRA